MLTEIGGFIHVGLGQVPTLFMNTLTIIKSTEFLDHQSNYQLFNKGPALLN
jgi:hypothetical protein